LVVDHDESEEGSGNSSVILPNFSSHHGVSREIPAQNQHEEECWATKVQEILQRAIQIVEDNFNDFDGSRHVGFPMEQEPNANLASRSTASFPSRSPLPQHLHAADVAEAATHDRSIHTFELPSSLTAGEAVDEIVEEKSS
jgi:hypothetical protein